MLGIVVAPGISRALAAWLADDLRSELANRLTDVSWTVELTQDGLVQPPATDTEIVSAARQLLLDRGWDLAVCLTDLPLKVARRPVVAHASPVHGVAVLSVPALGAVAVRRRTREAVLRLLDALLGEASDPNYPSQPDQQRHSRITRRARELGSDTASSQTLPFTARVLTGHLRLLTGMVRANRPWQLAARLSRALAAAGAAGVFALVSSDIWRLATAFGWLRLAAVAAGSVAALAAALILGAGLWEHARHRRARQQVVLSNLAITATVLIGVAAFYAALFLLALAAAVLLVVPHVLAARDRPSHRHRQLCAAGDADFLAGYSRRRAGCRAGNRRCRAAGCLRLPDQRRNRARCRLTPAM